MAEENANKRRRKKKRRKENEEISKCKVINAEGHSKERPLS